MALLNNFGSFQLHFIGTWKDIIITWSCNLLMTLEDAYMEGS